MALKIEVGSFVQPGATGNQTVNLADATLDGKALIIWCTPVAAAGIVAHASMAVGYGTYRGASVQQVYIAGFAEDNVATADTYRAMGTDALLRLCGGTGAVDAAMTLVSLGTGSFVVNWSNLHTTASIVVNYMIFGGDDVLDAEAGSFTYSAATGAQDVTLSSGMGHPDVVFFARTARINDSTFDAEGEVSLGFGVRSGSGNGRSAHFSSDDAVATEASVQRTNNNSALYSGTGTGTVEFVCTLAAESGWPTDGFEINKTVASFAEDFQYLAIRFSSDVTVTTGEVAAPTSGTPPVTRTLTCANTPRGALIIHNRTATANTTDSSSADDGILGVGAMDGTRERWAGVWDDDGQATASVASSAWTDTKSYRSYTPNNDTLVAEADGQINGSNFELSFNDVDTIATIIEYITFGENAGAAAASLVWKPPPTLHLPY
jgi:hypothetical protein